MPQLTETWDEIGYPVEPVWLSDLLRRMAEKRVELNKHTKKRFVNILLRVAKAHEGISWEERTFIRQFWRELQKL